MPHRETAECMRCGRVIDAVGTKAIAMVFFAQTVGIQPRQKSKASRIYFCTRCSNIMAMGPKPTNGALNVTAQQMVKSIVASNPAVTQAAWEELNRSVLAPELEAGEGEVLPPERRLKAS